MSDISKQLDEYDRKFKASWQYKVFYVWYYPFWRKVIRPVRMFPKEVKWFVQRGRRGYSDADLWDYGYHLINQLIEVLPTFKGEITIPPSKADYSKMSDAAWDYARKRGDRMLDRAIADLEYYKKVVYDDIGTHKQYLRAEKRLHRAFGDLGKHIGRFWT